MMLFLALLALASCGAPNKQSKNVLPTPRTAEPRYGGTFRMIMRSSPTGLSPPATVGPEEKLMDVSPDRSEGNGLEPVLAEKVEEDVAHNRIVFYLRKGVRFHDGSELNADVVIWNFQVRGPVQYSEYLKGITKIDDMTVQFEYTEYSNQLLQSWGFMPIFSEAAWERASGGDAEKGYEWSRTHCVGTGPFMLQDYQVDDHITWVKNPDYWRKGEPYLDGIEYTFVPDATTARMMMLAGEADYWGGWYDKELDDDGFTVLHSWLGLSFNIWPNTADPDSRWTDIRLREALEYAIDKPAIAEIFNTSQAPDTWVPMTMMAPPGEWGFDPEYPTRTYNPEKARQLLAEAGYADGLDVKILMGSDQGSRDFGALLKFYLDEVGMRVTLDLADPGRFYSTVYGANPGPDLSVMYSGMDTNYLVTYMRWFSTDPLTNLSYLGHTPEQAALDEEAQEAFSVADQKIVTEKLVSYLSDNALIIPIIWYPISSMAAPKVHMPNESPKGGRWLPGETWLEEK